MSFETDEKRKLFDKLAALLKKKFNQGANIFLRFANLCNFLKFTSNFPTTKLLQKEL